MCVCVCEHFIIIYVSDYTIGDQLICNRTYENSMALEKCVNAHFILNENIWNLDLFNILTSLLKFAFQMVSQVKLSVCLYCPSPSLSSTKKNESLQKTPTILKSHQRGKRLLQKKKTTTEHKMSVKYRRLSLINIINFNIILLVASLCSR